MHDEIYLESSVMTHCFTVGGIKTPTISHFFWLQNCDTAFTIQIGYYLQLPEKLNVKLLMTTTVHIPQDSTITSIYTHIICY